jgi:putative endonuclease
VEQLVARWAHNPKATGSSPVPATSNPAKKRDFLFMYTVYVLYSVSFNKIYMGYSSDISSRLDAHNHPKNHGWTKRYQPWELLYSEEYSDKQQAMKREKELKSYQGRLFIRNIIANK